MILFNRDDRNDLQTQLEYLNSLPQYKLSNLSIVKDAKRSFDFYNVKCIIEYKRRNSNHNTFPDFILEKYKYDTNMDIALRNKLSFYYQNRFNDGKVWEWDLTAMTEKNLMPEPIEKEMNRYTYVADPTKTTKKVYMLKLDQGYEI